MSRNKINKIWSHRKGCYVKATWWRKLLKNLGWFWDIYCVPIVFCICLVVTVVIAVVWYKADKNAAIERYNNGICHDCGGEYKYDQAVGHYFDTTYIYKCDKCGNIVELNEYVPNKEK